MQVSELTPKEEACGLEDPSRVCEQIFDWTDSGTLAELSQWVIDRPFRILVILIMAVVLNRFARRAITALSDRIRETPSHPRLRALRELGPGGAEVDAAEAARAPARAEALESVLKSLATATIWILALLLVLGELSINLAPLIAGAGIAGIAIGFGAQSVVSDFLAGMFMLMEDQYGIGDVIEVEGVTGEVEDISLRTTQLRDANGTVWHVPNGQIKKVGNHSQLWSRAVIDITVAYDADLRLAMRLMEEVAGGLTGDDSTELTLEEVRVLGVQELGDNAVTLRLVGKTEPSTQWQVQRELRIRLKEAFDAAGIEIPFPQRTIHLTGPLPTVEKATDPL